MSGAVVVFVFLAITLAALPFVSSRTFRALVARIDAVAERPAIAMLVCGLLSFVGSMLVALLVMWPEPRIHDEFSYLLAVDTFLHGRLTNPTHPLWQHFESFHIFHEPTYASKYPPAQGLALALGTVLTGSPVGGLWLSGALMCAAICWTLYGFVSPRWAFLGAVLATAQIGIATYWTQTFWGGAVAATGGALVFGAAARLGRDANRRDALWLGLGLVMLANSRPFEGAGASLAAAAYLAIVIWRQPARRDVIAIPIIAVLAIGGVAMAAYNHAVVGSWWLPPYVHHEQLYVVKPTVVFQDLRAAPVFRHDVMRDYYVGPPTGAAEDGSSSGVVAIAAEPPGLLAPGFFGELRAFFVGRVLLVPLLVGALAVFASAEAAMLAGSIVLTVASVGINFYPRVHYAAPLTASLFALITIGLARIETLTWPGPPVRRALLVAVFVSALGSLALEISRVPSIHTVHGTDDFYQRRLRVLDTLQSSPGKDLVVVEYGPSHDIHREWVYNAADIDAADIVWARSMGPVRDRELLDYFSGRRAWRLRDGFGTESDGLTPHP